MKQSSPELHSCTQSTPHIIGWNVLWWVNINMISVEWTSCCRRKCDNRCSTLLLFFRRFAAWLFAWRLVDDSMVSNAWLAFDPNPSPPQMALDQNLALPNSEFCSWLCRSGFQYNLSKHYSRFLDIKAFPVPGRWVFEGCQTPAPTLLRIWPTRCKDICKKLAIVVEICYKHELGWRWHVLLFFWCLEIQK